MCVRFREQVGDEIFTGLTVVAFSLQDISEADGGFACIPSAPPYTLHVTPCSSRPSAVCLAAASATRLAATD